MEDTFPHLFANELGIWREDKPGFPFGIVWSDISTVGGYKLDCIPETYLVVTLDFEYGEWLELYADWRGFSEVVQAITARLPGIRRSWFREIEQLSVGDPPIIVWQRTEHSAINRQEQT